MKYAFSTLACPAWSIEQVAEAATRMGYNGVELRLLDGKVIDPVTDRLKVIRATAICRDHGLEVCALDTSCTFNYADPEERARQMAEERVNAYTATMVHRLDVEDIAAAVLQFRNGAIGTILGSTAIFPGLAERLEISGSDGSAIVEDGNLIYMASREALGDVGSHGRPWDRGSISRVAQETTPHAPPYGGRHTDQIADFINAVVQGRPLAVTASDGRAALALVLAIYRSAATHREVVLDDA